MTTVTRNQHANSHYLQSCPFSHFDKNTDNIHPNFDAPVPKETQEFLKEFAQQAYGQDIEIIGALWDYSKAADDYDPAQHLGHYRIALQDGSEHVLAIHPHDGAEALKISAPLLVELEQWNIPTRKMTPFTDGSPTKEFKGVYIHQETFYPVKRWLSQGTVTDFGYQIGQIAGALYIAGQALSKDKKQAMREYTDTVTLNIINQGINHINEGSQPLKANQQDIQELLNALEHNQRTASTLNLIEKMLWVDNDEETLHIAAYCTAARGFLPMITDNATIDTGLAVARIITEKRLYPDTPERQDLMQKNLRQFVEGYNKISGKKLTYEEALKAGKLSLMALNTYALGAKGNQLTNAVAEEHIKTTLLPLIKNQEEVAALMTQPPRADTNALSF